MTNILFLTFYYGFIFPAGFFFASATLAVHYWVDKFCLLRVWSPAPMLGSEIADISRVYFLSAAIAVYAVMSSYNYASFPYDNACGTCCRSSACNVVYLLFLTKPIYPSNTRTEWKSQPRPQSTLAAFRPRKEPGPNPSIRAVRPVGRNRISRFRASSG